MGKTFSDFAGPNMTNVTMIEGQGVDTNEIAKAAGIIGAEQPTIKPPGP